MALTYRFYRSTVLGTGTREDPWRSRLAQYIVADGSGSDFWDWIHDGRPVRYAVARAESAVHDAIAADPDIVGFSPELADQAEIDTWLDTLFSTLGAAAVSRLENDGISTAWVSAPTTIRDVMRYASKLHVITQELKRLRNLLGLNIFGRALEITRSQLTASQRNAIADWMTARGLDFGWTTGATTMRQLIHYILSNINWPVLHLGPIQI